MLQDLVYGIRLQLKTPAATAALVLTLALGIAATSVSFTFTNSLFLRPLPVREPEGLVRIYNSYASAGTRYWVTSYPEVTDIQALRTVFSGVVAEQPVPYNFSTAGEPERIWGQLVAGGYFSVLGVVPELGRFFADDEERVAGGEPVVVLSHSLWQRRFAGSARATTERVLLNGHPVKVIGVAPPRFHGMTVGLEPDVWVPAIRANKLYPVATGEWLQNRSARSFFVTARLAPGVALAQARSALDVLAARLQRDYPRTNQGVKFAALPESQSRVHPLFQSQVLGASAASLGVAIVVLLVACANVAGVLLVRASMRRREMGVRLALGATRGRLVRQLLTENTPLSLLAGGLGMIVGFVVTNALGKFRVSGQVAAIRLDMTPDARVLGFGFAITVATGILFGLAPALDGARCDPVTMVKDGDAMGAPRQSRLRAALIAAQVALSIVLLVGGGLFFRSLQNAEATDVGFDPHGAVMTSFDLGLQNYSVPQAAVFFQKLRDRIRALPNADRAALGSNVPLELNLVVTSIAPEGYKPPPDGSWPMVQSALADDGYFAAMRMPLLEGREFSDTDVHGAPDVVILNDVVARQFWPEGRWVGRRVVTKSGLTLTVVGVARRAKYLTLGEEPKAYVYFPFRQIGPRSAVVVVRTHGELKPLLRAIGDEIHALDPEVPLYDVKTLDEHVAIALTPARSSAATLGIIGTVALFLTSLGLYGSIAHVVSRRTFEIGVRRALGAEDADVAWLVVRGAATLVMVGLASGAVLAVAAARLLRSVLYGVDPLDPFVFGAAPIVLLVVCGIAAWIPARKAIRVDAATALRYQ